MTSGDYVKATSVTTKRKNPVTLLLSSAGRRVEVVRHFREDAEQLGLDLRIVATDVDAAWCAACHRADVHHQVAPADTPEFIEQMLSICAQHGVDFILPTIDLELEPLARHQAEFREQGVDVIVSSLDTVRLARDKLQTARVLDAHGVPVPRGATPSEILSSPADWPGPLIAKPRGGWSSLGLRQFASAADISGEIETDDYVVQELLQGDEYTINLYFDRSYHLVCSIPHIRREVRAGEVSKGVTRRHEQLDEVCKALEKALDGPRGPLCIQAMITPDGRIGVFEINARIGGGYPLAHAAGAHFTKWLLEEAAGLSPSYHNEWRTGVTMLRYDAAVVIDEPVS